MSHASSNRPAIVPLSLAEANALAGRNVSTISKKRQRVYERDKGICVWCGTKTRLRGDAHHPLAATLDHIIPHSRSNFGGEMNLIIACRRCNNLRGAWDVRRFARQCRRVGMAVDYVRLHEAVERVGGLWVRHIFILPARWHRTCTFSWPTEGNPGYSICGQPAQFERYYIHHGKRNREPWPICMDHAFRDQDLAEAAGTALARMGRRLAAGSAGASAKGTPPLPRPMTGMVRIFDGRSDRFRDVGAW